MHFCYVSRYISRYISFWTTQPGYVGRFSVGTLVGSIQDFRFPEICRSSPVLRSQRSVPGRSKGQTRPRPDRDPLLVCVVREFAYTMNFGDVAFFTVFSDCALALLYHVFGVHRLRLVFDSIRCCCCCYCDRELVALLFLDFVFVCVPFTLVGGYSMVARWRFCCCHLCVCRCWFC